VASHCRGYVMAESALTTEEQLASLWSLGGLTWKELAKRVWQGIQNNDLLNRAYELAYNFLLAVFPMLLVLLALLGIFAQQSNSLRDYLFYYFQVVLPPLAYQLVTHTLTEIVRASGGGKLTFGLLFALWSGSAGMTQLMTTLNAAYAVREQRSWVKIHLISLCLTLAISVLIMVALLLVVAGGYVLNYAAQHIGMSDLAYVGVKIAQWLFALAFVVVAFAVIYYFAPNVYEQHWYWITPGSLVGVSVWVLASAGLRLYLHFANSYSKSYGSLGAVMILMLWFYVTGLAFLIGGQINATIEHAAAEHGHTEAKAAGEKKAA
jgi:membrane protein